MTINERKTLTGRTYIGCCDNGITVGHVLQKQDDRSRAEAVIINTLNSLVNTKKEQSFA